MTKTFKKFLKYIFVFIFFSIPFTFLFASETDGTINSINHSALLCENYTCTTTTQINFLTSRGQAVQVTDTKLTGHIWSEKTGWINLNSSNGGVTNTEDGTLGGYAWGENTGWINFNPTNGGVTINNSGKFVGWAWAQNYGWIKFNCSVANACVETDWRPIGARDGGSSGSTGGGTTGGEGETPTPTPNPTPIPEEPVEIPINPLPVELPVEPENVPIQIDEETNDVETESNNTQIQNILDEGANFLDDIFLILQTAINTIFNIFSTPIGSIVSKTLATIGVVTGFYFSLISMFTNPLSFSELILIPMRLWSLLLVAFGVKKRNRPWGTVYDSVTKQPLDPAYVVLQDLNGNEIATSITDLDGRYGFLVPAGQYRIVANKTNYEFPSKKMAGKSSDELYQELYFNEVINVNEDGEVISKNIPMDPIKFDWNEFAKRDQNVMRFFSKREIWIARASNTLFILGFLFSIIATIISPNVYNIIIICTYALLFILKKTILKHKVLGWIRQKETKNPLSFAIMRVFFADSGNEVIHKVTDKTGKYYCLIPNGRYYAKIENKNLDERYSLVYTSEPIEVKKGYINKKFEV
ncbi:MAG TPA: carboxypeptidase-like regulatory domain-containing protein [Candidatus Paceibacterota bacterium]|nr:carboxypeptidase-like regulatory domain-containing protein [Candidatus Paceibacterota bacterium]HPT18305.1 carboxypeptidase-like regulatory domain-containing protein [Candidatus Paceibacterota bacterium]